MYRKVQPVFAKGMSRRRAARRFNISRDCARKILALSAPSGYRRTTRLKRPKLDGFTAIIDGWHAQMRDAGLEVALEADGDGGQAPRRRRRAGPDRTPRRRPSRDPA